jgi:hypothetical protein
MAAGNAQLLDVQALALLSDDEFYAVRRAVMAETQRRVDRANAVGHLASLQEVLAAAGGFDDGDVNREIRGTLDRLEGARSGYKISVSATEQMVVTISGSRATLESMVSVFKPGGVLEAVRTFAAASLGASEFVVAPDVTHGEARAFWINGE